MCFRILLISFCMTAHLCVSTNAGTPVGTAFTYQGKLTNSAGAPLSDSYNLSFKLFDAPTGGSQIGSTISLTGVNVSAGLFSVQLDFGAGAFNGEKRWVETAVGTETLLPRTEITGMPYAASALSVAPNGLVNYAGSIQNLASTAANPVALGSVDIGGMGLRVKVSGDYAYLAGGGGSLRVVDVSNPVSPAVLASVGTGESMGLAITGRYAFVVNHHDSQIHVFDVSNPTIPALVGSVGTNAGPYEVVVAGKYAYVVNEHADTMQVIDVSNPGNPVVVGTVATDHMPDHLGMMGRYVCVICRGSGTMQVIDVSNPLSPSVVGSIGIDGYPLRLAISGRYACVVKHYWDSMQIIDLSNPSAPALAGSVATGSFPSGIAACGRYVYVTNHNSNTLQIIDISNPASPTSVCSVGTHNGPGCVAVAGRKAYVVNDWPAYALQVIDLAGLETTAANIHSLEAGTLQVRGSAFINEQLLVRGGLNVGASGNFAGTVSANGVALTSDVRFKTNVETLRDAVGIVGRLRGVSFDWNRDLFPDRNFSDSRQIGFIAQEVEQVLPELVSKDAQGYEGVAYQNLVPLLVEAVKQQQATIEKQQKQIDRLTELVDGEAKGR